MSVYNRGNDRQKLSTIGRMHAAHDRLAAAQADRADPHKNLVRRVRAETLALATIKAAAALEWEHANKPVMLPAGARPPELHPTRVAAIAALMVEQGWSDDPRAPCVPVPSLADVTEAVAAETRQRLEEAQAALIAFEDDRRREALGEADHDSVTDGLAFGTACAAKAAEADAPRRGTVRPPKPRAVDISALGDE